MEISKEELTFLIKTARNTGFVAAVAVLTAKHKAGLNRLAETFKE